MVFMSSTGVKVFFDNLASDESLYEPLRAANFLAVGPRTRDALARSGVKIVSVPDSYSSAGVDEFFSGMKPKNLRIVLIRSSSANDYLAKALEKQGAVVTTINTYECTVPTDLETTFNFLEGLSEGRFYAILFTSAISASNLFEIAKRKMNEAKLIDLLKSARIGTIGPATADELRKRGIESIVPEEYLIEAALKKLIGEWVLLEHQSVAS